MAAAGCGATASPGADPGGLLVLFLSPVTAALAVKASTTTELLHNDPR